MNKLSKLQRYAVGNVVKTNSGGVYHIDILLTEINPNLSTDLKSGKSTTFSSGGVSGKLTRGEETLNKKKLTKGSIVNAMWLRKGGNRITPENVSVGETVSIYKLEGVDVYYWETLFYEPNLRDKENVCYAFSNLDREKDEDTLIDSSNTYYFTMSPKTKEVRLHTNKNDEEPMEWTFEILTGKGNLSIKNSNGDIIYMEKDKILLKTKTIDLEAKTINIKGSGEVNIETPNLNISGGAVKVDSTVDFNKAINVKAPSSFKAPASFSGNATVSAHSIVN